MKFFRCPGDLRSSLVLPLAFALTLASLGTAAPASAATAQYDECESDFIAFVGSDVYQFSPALPAELGTVHLFSVLSYQKTAAMGDFGRAFWRLEIRGPLAGDPGVMADTKAPLVRVAGGVARIEADGQARVDYAWNGRDESGKVVGPGHYEYTFRARFLPDRVRWQASRYEDLEKSQGLGVAEARSSTRDVIVDDRMDALAARQTQAAALAGVCQKQRNTPIETGFGYNFYYGSTHSHSNWSDGGQPTSNCASGNAYGSGTFTPANIYDYARNTAGLDYWVVNEHNHLLDDAMTTNAPPVTETKIKARYQSGLAAAAAATVNDAFIAVYGMEWGVLTNTDEGHVTLLETPTLFGWETCSTCNGPNQECTTGSNCYFDVFTPKRFGYLNMYKTSLAHPSPQGALGILCHPEAGQFDNFAFNADADNALQGIAVRSGVAFNTSTTCAAANIASTDYVPLWQSALNKGFHLGPTADHDAHCITYGIGMPDRTVYLLPNGSSPVLTKAALLSAHKARHFFATEDANAQLVFVAGTHIMGDIFTSSSPLTLRAAAYDPDGETISRMEIWRGQIGGGVPTAAYRTVTGASTLSLTETQTSGTYYYYVHAVQADGNNLWSAPMWITYSGTGCSDTTAPAVALTAPAAGATITCADTTITGTASDASGIQSAEVQIDGGAWSAATFNATAGTFSFAWASSGATSGSHTIAARATDSSCNHNIGTTAARSVTVANSSCGTSADVSGWKLTQQSSTQTYTLPAGTTIASKGYLIVARDATKSAFEAFWRGGTPLPSNVTFVDSAGVMPQINGSETYSLANASATVVDGPTIAMPSSANSTVQRKDPCLAAGTASSWTTTTITGAVTGPTPGSGAGTGCGKGPVINEFSDALGTNNFVYEFVEIYNDK